jgi:hypothetical protein
VSAARELFTKNKNPRLKIRKKAKKNLREREVITYFYAGDDIVSMTSFVVMNMLW